jgi:uncharacterized metal-binding protein
MEKLIALSVNGTQIQGAGGVPTGGTGVTLNKILSTGVSLLMLTAVILCVVFFIWGGISWITSGGDKQKLEQAHKKVTFAILGLILVFLAFFIINFVYSFFFGWGGVGGGAGNFLYR